MSATTRWPATRPVDVGVPGPTAFDMARAFRSVRADPLASWPRSGSATATWSPSPCRDRLSCCSTTRPTSGTCCRPRPGTGASRRLQYAALARVTGPGLLASAEPAWITHRRLAAPAFHHQRLEAVGDQVRAAADAAITSRARPASFADGAASSTSPRSP